MVKEMVRLKFDYFEKNIGQNDVIIGRIWANSLILENLLHLNENLHTGVFLDAKSYGKIYIGIFKNISSPNDINADQILANNCHISINKMHVLIFEC